MAAGAIDPNYLTRGITYLYRWWLQAELGIVPEAYIRRAGEATLICPDWALIGSTGPISRQEINDLKSDLGRPIYACCPDLVAGVPGIELRNCTCRDLPSSLMQVFEILKKNQALLQQLGEENPDRDEWWRTRDAGEFKIWKAHSCRLLLYPKGGQVYGFAPNQGKDGGYFFFRSKSCKEEGRLEKYGNYKVSEHALPAGRRVNNLDLLFSDGKVLLFRLLPTGAGYKVFPRRVLGHEGSLE